MSRRGASIKSVAESLECTTQAIHNYLKGRFFPTADKLMQLENLLSVKFVFSDVNVGEPIYTDAPRDRELSDLSLTIPEAKAAIARKLGVPVDAIKITVEA